MIQLHNEFYKKEMNDINIERNNLLPPIVTHLSLKRATYVGKTSWYILVDNAQN